MSKIRVNPAEKEKFYQEGADWDTDTVRQAKSSEKRAWFVAVALFVITVPSVIGLAVTGPLHERYPVIVEVDRTTGNVEVLEYPSNRRLADIQALTNGHWAQKYIIARESYFYPLLQDDYNAVKRMSSDDVWKDYASRFEGPEPLDKLWGDSKQAKIKIISVVFPPDSADTAIVRYRKTVRQIKSGAVESADTYVANFRFTYSPAFKATEAEMIGNPLGYKVIAYRDVPEVAQEATAKQH